VDQPHPELADAGQNFGHAGLDLVIAEAATGSTLILITAVRMAED